MSSGKEDFYYKEVDPEGHETLRVISAARKFNKWTFDSISQFCSGEILEIGSGIGNISEHFIDHGHCITLSDIRENYRESLRKNYGSKVGPEGIIELDLVEPDFSNTYQNLKGRFDTIFALNVVEHIEDDLLAIKNASTLLKPGGRLIILVPAFNSLYNSFDKHLMHFRRYTKSTLSELFMANELKVLHSYYFNAAGIPGWYVSGRLQKHDTIPGGQMRLFNSLVPVFRLIDLITFRKIGLSVVCVGEKLGE